MNHFILFFFPHLLELCKRSINKIYHSSFFSVQSKSHILHAIIRYNYYLSILEWNVTEKCDITILNIQQNMQGIGLNIRHLSYGGWFKRVIQRQLMINDTWIQETFVIAKTSNKGPKILPG